MIKVKEYFKISEDQSKKIISEMSSFFLNPEKFKDSFFWIETSDGTFELKIREIFDGGSNFKESNYFKLTKKDGLEKITDIKEIKRKLGIEFKSRIEDFLSEKGFTPFMKYEVNRQEVKKGGKDFRIDNFKFDNGLKENICRIQLVGVKEGQEAQALSEINNLAKHFELEKQDKFPKEKYLEMKRVEQKNEIKTPIKKISMK